MNYNANLYIISSPSGAGKSTLLNKLFTEMKINHPMEFSISHTTRQMREGEIDGVHYYFVSQEEFKRMISNNEFVEWAQVFDNYYGTSKINIEKNIKNGTDVFLDIDWQGARQIRKVFPEAKSIFILPPSLKELEKRLIGRGQDSIETIKNRMSKAKNEIIHYGEYDYVIVNDDLNQAYQQLRSIIIAEQTKTNIQKIKLKNLIEQFK